MHNLNFTDETFDINQSHNYFLSMESSLDGFTYSICDMIRNKCILLRHFSTECTDWNDFTDFLKQILESDPVLSAGFKVVHHTLVSQSFAVVPEAFVSDDENVLMRYLPGEDSYPGSIIGTRCEAARATVICTYQYGVSNLLKGKYADIKLSHHALPFLNRLLNDSVRSLRYIFHLLVQKDYFIVGVAHSGSLDFINAFKGTTVEDIVYFTLSVLEKFKTAPSLGEIFLVNEANDPELAVKLQDYIGRVKELKAPHNLVYSYVISEGSQDRFSNLLNVYNCE
jgi:hypothetical protein